MLYLGPEVLMPLASVAAAIGGVFLMFWRRIRAGARAVYRVVTRQPMPTSVVERVGASELEDTAAAESSAPSEAGRPS